MVVALADYSKAPRQGAISHASGGPVSSRELSAGPSAMSEFSTPIANSTPDHTSGNPEEPAFLSLISSLSDVFVEIE